MQLIERAIEQQWLMYRGDFNLVGRERKRQTRLKQRELRRGKVGYAKVTHFSALVQIEERGSDFIGVHQRVWTVDQQQIKAVGRQIHQRLLGTFDDVIAVSDVMPQRIVRIRRGRDAAFSDNLHTFTQRRR
ncbi:hypothetical protein D3C80_1495770 [compost metagenome]